MAHPTTPPPERAGLPLPPSLASLAPSAPSLAAEVAALRLPAADATEALAALARHATAEAALGHRLPPRALLALARGYLRRQARERPREAPPGPGSAWWRGPALARAGDRRGDVAGARAVMAACG